MNFVDYRKALGLGFDDRTKEELFFNKITIILNGVNESRKLDIGSFYFKYCYEIGSSIDNKRSVYGTDRFYGIMSILNSHKNSIKEYLLYYMIFANMMTKQIDIKYNAYYFIDGIKSILNELHIDYEIKQDKDECFIFPKGAEELDLALVTEPLNWLEDYPDARRDFIKALKDYSNREEDNISVIADNFRKALETFFKEFFEDNDIRLESAISTYGSYLKENGVPADIRNNFETLLKSFCNFNNNYAKHRNKTDENVLEYIMYQTGNIIRLLITLKKSEQE